MVTQHFSTDQAPMHDYHVEVVVAGETKHYDVRDFSVINVTKNITDIFKNYGPIVTRVTCTSGFKPR